MELERKSLLAVEADQEGEPISLHRSDMDVLTACSNEMEGTVIIYDNNTQEGQVVKIITNPESKSDSDPVKDMDDFSDLITLHASSDAKHEVSEEPNSDDMVDLRVETSNNSEEPEIDSDDDETIATFITSTGQQLALYAVEDSDEIFAVALYDESGEPPTNFHFLMKADVERLIGEGAVKTVKKPQAQQNKGTKPPEKREEIKFERYQDVKPTVQKVETPSPQIKKVETPPQIKKVEQVKPEMIEVPQPRSQMGLSHKSQPQIEVSKPKSQMEVSKPRPQVEASKPQPQADVAKPKSQMEVPKSTVQVEVSKPRSQMGISKSIAQVEVSKLRPQIAVSKARTQVEVTKPKTYLEVARPRPQVQMSKPRPQVEASNIKSYGEIAKPRAQVEIPKSKTQMQVPKTKPQVAIATTKSQVGASKFKPQMEAHKFQLTKAQEMKNQKVVQPKTIITKNTPGIKKIFTPMKQSTPKIVNKVISNVSQPTVNVKKEASIAYVWTNESESFISGELHEEIDSDAEIIEQSTVQYILCDEDPSDEELTFDELQASLQSFNMSTSVNKSKTFEVEKSEKKNDSILRYSPKKPQHKLAPILSQKKEVTPTVYRTYKNPKKARTMNNLLQTHRKIKQEVEDPSYDFSSFDDGQFSSDDLPKESDKQAVPPVKAKRSRKQQLTVVNRTDSEIIIQPASAFSEEEEEPVIVRKRGRRRKKSIPDPDYNPRRPARKKTRSNRSVEVINIDVEEGELAAAIASGKGKGSSDKENDVISVGDSEEDEEEEEEEEEEEASGGEGPASKRKKPPVMQCTHCLRNFRKRRALERHLHACPKSPANLQKLEERKRQQAAAGKVPKRFKCKSCDETFDIAVALARHVRVTHSPRKRGRPVKPNWSRVREYASSDNGVDQEEESSEESEPEPEPEPERGRGKRRVRRPVINRSSREESSGHDFELKLDSSGEHLSGPRRRGRPPVKKLVAPKKEPTPDLEEKSTGDQRKRGRRRKQSLSIERSMTPEPDEGDDRPAEPRVQIPKKRGRPIIPNLPKEEKSDTETEEKADSESRKRGRQSKPTGSKEDTEKIRDCVKVEVKLVPVEIPKKRKLSKDQPTEGDHETNRLEEKDEAPAKPIAEIPKKRRLSKEEPFLKDMEKPAETETSKIETKVEKSAEPPADSKGKPILKEEIPKVTEPKEKVEAMESTQAEEITEETTLEPKRKDTFDEEIKVLEKIEEATMETQTKSPLPVKDNSSKEDTEPLEDEIKGKNVDEDENTEEETSKTQKSGVSAKDESSKEDNEAFKEETKVETAIASPEPKKRGRPKENPSTSSEPEEPIIESSPESRKRGRTSKESPSKERTPESVEAFESLSPETRKRSRSAKDKTTKEDSQEAESSASESTEVRKRSLTVRSSPEVEIAEAETSAETTKDKVSRRKLPSPTRTWKVKKLNCADCGKWFSSAAALSTHRLKHRTKKSGHRVQWCRVCHKRFPAETYAKHQALAHGRAPAADALAPELRRRGRARQVVAGAARRRRSLRSAN